MVKGGRGEVKRRIWLGVVLLLLTTVPLLITEAQAAVVPLDLPQLTLRADLILRGRVIHQVSRWDGGGEGIYTFHTLQVTDTIKGEGGEGRVVVQTPGGIVGDIGLAVFPAARFTIGEEVLVFLRAVDSNTYQVIGSIQGKYAIRRGWAVNDELGTAWPLIGLVKRVLAIMAANGIDTPLPADWVSRFPPPAAPPPRYPQPLDFVYEGVHWPGPNPMGEPYLVNLSTVQDVHPDLALQAILDAADTWTSVSGADFVFEYGGDTTVTDFTTEPNGQNDIAWKDKGNTGDWANVLAKTRVWYRRDTGEISEADMVINEYYPWDTNGARDAFDLQSVVLHEFGHFLRLEHDSDPEAVMYASIAPGEVGRILHPNDVAGIRYIYPAPCLSDFDGNGVVDIGDLAALAGWWRSPLGEDPILHARYDLNGDGVVNVIDMMKAAAFDPVCH